jgi:hypothetical protein
MNERIQDLWLQAAREDSDDSWDSQTQFIERFAQLIVRECASIYDRIDNGNLHQGTDDYLEALHRTFLGVEE